MCLDNIIEMVKAGIESKDSSARVIYAYPNAFKPTRLDKVVVALSPSVMDMQAVEIGGDAMVGEMKVLAQIYVPLKMGISRMKAAIRDVSLGGSCGLAQGIAVGNTAVDNDLSVITAPVTFTFNQYFV